MQRSARHCTLMTVMCVDDEQEEYCQAELECVSLTSFSTRGAADTVFHRRHRGICRIAFCFATFLFLFIATPPSPHSTHNIISQRLHTHRLAHHARNHTTHIDTHVSQELPRVPLCPRCTRHSCRPTKPFAGQIFQLAQSKWPIDGVMPSFYTLAATTIFAAFFLVAFKTLRL